MTSRTQRHGNFRKAFAFTCIAFLITIGLLINRPASAAVTVTAGVNFQVDITGGEAVSVDCSAGNVRVTVDAVPNVTATPCITVTSLRVTAVGAFNNTLTLSGVTTAAFIALTSVDVDGGAGNDTITGSEFGDQIRGGLGDDTITGGSGVDHAFGNEGNDTLIGGQGNDQLYGDDGDDRFGEPAVRDLAANDAGNDQFFGGAGSDEFFWDPGDGDDIVEGGAGDSDRIQFFGNAGAEQFFAFADLTNQSRLHIFRVQAAIDIDAADIEKVDLTANAGIDTLTVGRSNAGTLSDLSTTSVRVVNLLLGDDGVADSIIVEGRPVNDNIFASLPTTGDFDLVKVAGLSYDVILTGLDAPASDGLTVNGNDGDDEIKAATPVETALNITINGGTGNDVLSANTTLNGNEGNDRLEGGAGNNTMDGGAGDDVFVGNGGTDNLGGGAGSSIGDAVLLPGTAGNETFSLAMDGGGHLLATVNGVTTTYQNFIGGAVSTSGIELISVQGLAGNDTLTVDSGTAAVPIPINFAGGENVDSLNLTGGVATSDSYTAGPLVDQGISQVVIGGVAQTVSFSSIEPVTDLIAGPFIVNGNNANNAINYGQGSIAANGLVSVDNFETVEFSNKTGLTINGQAGDDVINLNNAATPTGLTSITVNGNDPTASDTLIVNGTSGNNTIAFSPSATIGAGNITINAMPPVAFTTMESVVIDGQGGTDGLTHTTPADVDQVTYVPGGAPDSGTIATRGAGTGTARVPLTFRHLGAGGSVTFASAGGREDVLELFGTDDSDIFSVNGTADTIQILNPSTAFVTDQLNTGGISLLQLRGLDGDDTFNLAAVLPYIGGTFVDGGEPSASDTLNLTGATGAITRTSPGTITGYGGSVYILGIERVSLAGSGGAASLTINGTAGDDSFSFSPTGANAGSFAVSGTNFSYSSVGGAFTLNFGTGFDTLAVQGTSSDDVVTSTATTVTVNGGTVTLGSGLERLSVTTSDGNDSITLSGVALPIIVDAGAGNDSVTGTGVTAAMTIFGGDGNDAIVGGSAIDSIYGGLGNDTMVGGGGNDQLYGDDGDDILGNPSATNNGVADDPGNDQFFGGAGSDSFLWEPGDGDDLVEGGAGESDQHSFFGNAGAEQFFLFADTNNPSRTHLFRVQASIDIDAADVEKFNISPLGGTDTITIGRSDLGVLGDLSTTTVQHVDVSQGTDGVADNLIFEGRPLDDNLLVSVSGPIAKVAGLSYDLRFEGNDALDRLTINGNEGNDIIKAAGSIAGVNTTFDGGVGNDTLVGSTGDDTLIGGNGDDVLVFTAGNDTMTGGPGIDTLRAEGNDAANIMSLSQAGTVVTISTGLASGTVDFTGALSMERIDVFAFGGNDTITVSGVSLPKTIDAGAGNDIVDLSAAVDANVIGGDGDDSVTGSPAIDNIDGGPGNDILLGLGGDDFLNGDSGNDTLTGGTGGDRMFGGGGSDILIWNNGDGSDLMEGGGGTDAVQVNGSNGSGDAFLVTPGGARVSFARTNLGLFSLDIGATEELTVNGLDGDDAFTVTPQAFTHITVNGGNPATAPGDQLNIDFTGALNSTKTPTGVGSGIWSFNNRQSINFNGIETQGPAGPGISIDTVAITEGNTGSSSANFTATLSAASAQTVSVDVSTANGAATAPVDYQSANATLTFLPGVTTANFSVPINGDNAPEGNETFFVNLTNAVNATISTPQGTGTINDDDSTNIFQFSSPTGNVNENAAPGSATVTVTRTGDLAGAASVQFETTDGTGKQKTDYTFGFGTVQFAPGEASKDVKILVVNDALIEGAETFRVGLANPSGNCAIGSPDTITVTINDDDVAAAPNPIDDAGFFVRQHYLDFLGREPDAGGLAFWTGQITACGGNASCIAAKRVDVSASFFLSIEFQETGGYALRIQRVAFGRQSDDQFTRYPYLPFMRDTRTIGQGVIVGQPGADALLEQNRQAYANGLVATEEFAIRFPSSPAAVYVDALFASAGVTPTAAERTAAINSFGAGGTTGRVAALRSVTDSASVRAAESRVSFVLAEYYGYLRRNPTDAPDFNNAGYQFWLNKLNLFNGNYIDAEMVKAFITSTEYRQRFGS